MNDIDGVPPNSPTAKLDRTGHYFDLLNPDFKHWAIREVAEGLTFVNRWEGQLPFGLPNYSVLHHSLNVEWAALKIALSRGMEPMERNRVGFAALGHDCREVIVGDVSRPTKIAMRRLTDFDGPSPYDHIEQAVAEMMSLRFGWPLDGGEIVHEADNVVLAWEANRFFQIDPETWGLPSLDVVDAFDLGSGHLGQSDQLAVHEFVRHYNEYKAIFR